jgi:hypothetical protein
MSIQDSLKSQYHASLEMLKQAVLKCPDALWEDPTYKNEFWNIAYHTLFYVHLYLSPSEKGFIPWAKNKPGYSDLTKGKEPYSKEEVLAYAAIVTEQVEQQVSTLDPDAASEFWWLPFSKLELQLYNIRHLQQHVGELCERLGVTADIDVEWVGKGKSE